MRSMTAGFIGLIFYAFIYAGVLLGLVSVIAGVVMMRRPSASVPAPVEEGSAGEAPISTRHEGKNYIILGIVLIVLAGAADYWYFFT